MADDSVSFGLELEDGITGPAKVEARALKDLTGSIESAEKSIKQLIVTQRALKNAGWGGEILARNKRELASMRKDLADMRSQRRELGGGEQRGSMFGSVLGGTLLANAIYRVGREAVEATIKVQDFILTAAQLKRSSILEYGGGKEGEDLFNRVQQRAVETHLPVDQAHELARDLRLQGLKDADLIVATIQSNAELVRTGQIRGAEKLRTIIEKSLASGHFDVKGLGGGKGGAEGSARALAGLGINQKDLLADLARRYKTDVATIKTMLKQGKIEAEVGIAAIDEAVSKGEVGKAARKLFTLSDFKTDVFNQFSRAAQSVDLRKFTQSLVDVDSTIERITSKGGPVEKFFQGMVDGSANVIDSISAFADEFELVFLNVENSAKEFRNWLVDHHMGWLVGLERTSTGGIGSSLNIKPVQDQLADEEATEQKAAKGNPIKAWLLGRDVTTGFIKGMKSTEEDIKSMAGDMGGAAEEGVRDKTQTHSPSELFADVGRDWAAGIVKGWNSASLERSLNVSPGSSPSGSVGGSGSVGPVYVHVDLMVNGAVDAETMRETALAAFTIASEQFAVELGSLNG